MKEASTPDMAKVLQRLTEAGWISRSMVSGSELVIDWTERGEAGMKALRTYFFGIEHLTDQQKDCLLFLISHFFPGGPDTI